MRVEHGQKFMHKIVVQPFTLLGVPHITRQKTDAFALKCRQQLLIPAGVLRLHQSLYPRAHLAKQFERTDAVWAWFVGADTQLLTQGGNANFKKFI